MDEVIQINGAIQTRNPTLCSWPPLRENTTPAVVNCYEVQQQGSALELMRLVRAVGERNFEWRVGTGIEPVCH